MNVDSADTFAKMRDPVQRVDDLVQTSKLYPWSELRPSILCGCFRFVLQLVLVGCCGSFLFGFNISLLNTAVRVISSDFKVCGELKPMAKVYFERMKTMPLQGLIDDNIININTLNTLNCEVIYENSVAQTLKCKGGHADLSCNSAKWYMSFLQSIVLLGGVFGAMFAGKLIMFGRRNLLIIVMGIFSIGVISSVVANSFSAMIWARFIVGIGVGVVSFASPTYISEITPRLVRGKYGVLHQLFITVGIFIGILIGLPLVDPSEQASDWVPPTFVSFWWRFMLGLGLVPVIIGAYLLLFVYSFETPLYYVEKNQYQDAYHLLERLHDSQDIQEEFDACVKNVIEAQQVKQKGMSLMSAFNHVDYRKVLIIGLLLAGFQQFGGVNVFVTSSSVIFAKAGLTKQMQTGMSIVMALINIVMTFPTIALIERLGRKQLLFIGSLCQFICIVPCAIAYWIDQDAENPAKITQILSIIAVIGFMVFFAVAFGPIVWVYLFEIFPIEIKDSASSVCTAFNWASAFIMVFVANVVTNQIGFTIFTVLQGAATLFVLFCIKETKGLVLGTSPYFKSKVHNDVESSTAF